MSQAKSTNDSSDLCPMCKAPLRLLRISRAAKMADVSSKTIYRYVEEGSVYAVRIAGKRSACVGGAC